MRESLQMSTNKKTPNLYGLLACASIGGISAAVGTSGTESNLIPLFIGSVSTVIGGVAINRASDYLKKISVLEISKWFGKHSQGGEHKALYELLKDSISVAFEKTGKVCEKNLDEKTHRREFNKAVRKIKKQIENDFILFADYLPTINEVNLILNEKPESYINWLVNELKLNNQLPSNLIDSSFEATFNDLLLKELQYDFLKNLLAERNEEAFKSFNLIISKCTLEFLENISNEQKVIKDKIDNIDITQSIIEISDKEIDTIVSRLNDKTKFIEIKGKFKNALNSVISNLEFEIQKVETKLIHELDSIRQEIKESRRENIGWFERIDKKTSLVIKLFLLGGIGIVLILVAYLYFTTPTESFTATIKVHGLKGKDDLILSGIGEVQIVLKGKELTGKINESGVAVFHEIPGKYKNQEVPVSVINISNEAYQVYDSNSSIQLQPNKLNYLIVKLAGIDTVRGTVHDIKTSLPLSGAVVTVAQISDTTESDGVYCIPIPIAKQTKNQDLSCRRLGYEVFQKNQLSILSNSYHDIYMTPN